MKSIFSLFLLLFLSSNSFADQMLALQSGCMGCHQVDKKFIGPALKEIAAKYKGQDGIKKKLVKQVKSGSAGGVWGEMPMIASQAPKENIEKVIDWIFTL